MGSSASRRVGEKLVIIELKVGSKIADVLKSANENLNKAADFVNNKIDGIVNSSAVPKHPKCI